MPLQWRFIAVGDCLYLPFANEVVRRATNRPFRPKLSPSLFPDDFTGKFDYAAMVKRLQCAFDDQYPKTLRRSLPTIEDTLRKCTNIKELTLVIRRGTARPDVLYVLLYDLLSVVRAACKRRTLTSSYMYVYFYGSFIAQNETDLVRDFIESHADKFTLMRFDGSVHNLPISSTLSKSGSDRTYLPDIRFSNLRVLHHFPYTHVPGPQAALNALPLSAALSQLTLRIWISQQLFDFLGALAEDCETLRELHICIPDILTRSWTITSSKLNLPQSLACRQLEECHIKILDCQWYFDEPLLDDGLAAFLRLVVSSAPELKVLYTNIRHESTFLDVIAKAHHLS